MGNLRVIAMYFPDILEMMMKPWMRAAGDDPHGYGPYVIQYLTEMITTESLVEVAVRVLELGILDTLELEDLGMLEHLTNLGYTDPEGLSQLLHDPSLTGDAVDIQKNLLALLSPEVEDQELAEVIEALPWMQDGLAGNELGAVLLLETLAAKAENVLRSLLDKRADWFLPKPGWTIDLGVLEHFVSISVLDNAAGLQLLEKQFLDTLESSDSEALRYLSYIAESDAEFTAEVLAHPDLDSNTDKAGLTVSVLYLGWKDPETAHAIKGLTWFQEVLDKPASDYPTSHSIPVRNFNSALRLVELAAVAREATIAIAAKPWMQDSLLLWEREVLSGLIDLALWDEQEALRVLEMPFLDSVGVEDDRIMEILHEVRTGNRGSLKELLHHPNLAGGISESDLAAVTAVSLKLEYPEAAAEIDSLVWVSDGVDSTERQAFPSFRYAALHSPQAFWALLDESWVQDGLSKHEVTAFASLSYLASGNLAPVPEVDILSLLDMPFLDTIDGVDAKALESLVGVFSEAKGAYLRQVLSHPSMSDGITNEEAIIVSVLSMVVQERPDLLDVLLDPEITSVEERVVSLPLAGDTRLFAVSVASAKPVNLDSLESVVRIVEEFMAVPFPRGYVGLLVADANSAGGGGGPGGILTVDPGGEHNIGLIAHETAHVYWGFAPEWLQEGPAEFMRVITESELSGLPVGPYDPSCGLAGNLGDLERLAHDLASADPVGASEAIYWSGCMYSLGQGLFTDLYQSMGRDDFRHGFGSLYLKLEAEAHGECTGLEQGVCYVKAAFVGDASPEAAAIAAAIIDKWY